MHKNTRNWLAAAGIILFIVMLILVLSYCKHREAVVTLPGISPMTLQHVKICDASSSCKLDAFMLVGQVVGESGDRIVPLLAELSRRFPAIRTICFNSPGGENKSAVAIATAIAKSKMDTCFSATYQQEDGTIISNTMCNSACPLMLLAGQSRTALGSDAKVGIHSSGESLRLCGCTLWTSRAEDERDKYRMLIASYSKINTLRRPYDEQHYQLLAAAFAVPHDSIRYIPPREAMEKFHLFTDVLENFNPVKG
ncbi:hypothetical protein ACTOWA_13735 [Herbaspirillum seropedicae]|uniref:hypothetical protein n=1 Tax=Herbaspirillum seropedicae TaxID=964 RepID=UPI003F8D5466